MDMMHRTKAPRRPAALRATGLAALVALSAAAVWTAPPAGALAPVGASTVVSKNIATSAYTYVSPIASSGDTTAFGKPFAIYERHNAAGRLLDVSGTLLAVTSGGKPYRIGVVTPDMTSFSLSGYTLTALSASDPTKVYYWDPGFGGRHPTYSTDTVGSGDRYLLSAPDGWVEIGSDGALYDVNAHSPATKRPLANPFGSSQDVRGTAGPNGIVVTNATKIAYVPFNGGPAVLLDTADMRATPGGSNTPMCSSVSSFAAACGSYYNDGEDDSGLQNVFLDPLTGGPAYALSTVCPRVGAATMLGSSAAWISCKGKLELLGEHGAKATDKTFNSEAVAGLGGYLFSAPGGHLGVRLSPRGTTITTVLPKTHATSEAFRFALTGGSLIWSENDSSAAPITIHRRAVHPNSFGTAVAAGTIHSLGTSKVSKGSIAAAGSSYVYATRYVNSTVGQNGGETLRVVAPSRTATITGVDRYMRVSLGDHRVLYFTDGTHARLYNLKTRHTSGFEATGAALRGNELAYCGTDGVVRLKNLDTGAVRQVAVGVSLNQGEIYVRGQLVGWNTWNGSYASYYRDMATQLVPVQLPANESIWSLSDAGMILETLTDGKVGSSPFFPTEGQLRNNTVDFLLRSYDDATTTELLHADHLDAGPQAAAGVVAWIGQHGKLAAQVLG